MLAIDPRLILVSGVCSPVPEVKIASNGSQDVDLSPRLNSKVTLQLHFAPLPPHHFQLGPCRRFSNSSSWQYPLCNLAPAPCSMTINIDAVVALCLVEQTANG